MVSMKITASSVAAILAGKLVSHEYIKSPTFIFLGPALAASFGCLTIPVRMAGFSADSPNSNYGTYLSFRFHAMLPVWVSMIFSPVGGRNLSLCSNSMTASLERRDPSLGGLFYQYASTFFTPCYHSVMPRFILAEFIEKFPFLAFVTSFFSFTESQQVFNTHA